MSGSEIKKEMKNNDVNKSISELYESFMDVQSQLHTAMVDFFKLKNKLEQDAQNNQTVCPSRLHGVYGAYDHSTDDI